MNQDATNSALFELLRHIDGRITAMTDDFHKHIENDRRDFRALHERIAEGERNLSAAAIAKIEEHLTVIGVEVTRPTEVQKDMAALRVLRDMMESKQFFEPLQAMVRWRDAQAIVKRAGLITATGIFLTGALATLWLGLADRLRELIFSH